MIDELVGAVEAALFRCLAATPSPTATLGPSATPTNPPGSCCGCAAVSFVDCQAQAQQGTCFGWGDPCPTPTQQP
jgi:hypothetical protein